MSMTDPIADMLVRIKNALAVGKPVVSMPKSKMKLAVAGVLKSEGYIGDVRTVGEGARAKIENTRHAPVAAPQLDRPGVKSDCNVLDAFLPLPSRTRGFIEPLLVLLCGAHRANPEPVDRRLQRHS